MILSWRIDGILYGVMLCCHFLLSPECALSSISLFYITFSIVLSPFYFSAFSPFFFFSPFLFSACLLLGTQAFPSPAPGPVKESGCSRGGGRAGFLPSPWSVPSSARPSGHSPWTKPLCMYSVWWTLSPLLTVFLSCRVFFFVFFLFATCHM